jgi:hypothetical protein
VRVAVLLATVPVEQAAAPNTLQSNINPKTFLAPFMPDAPSSSSRLAEKIFENLCYHDVHGTRWYKKGEAFRGQPRKERWPNRFLTPLGQGCRIIPAKPGGRIMRIGQGRIRLSVKAALGAGLAVVVAVLLAASPSLALSEEEITRENERFKALGQENKRLMEKISQKKIYQISDSHTRNSTLRKLRKAEANYQVMRTINKRLQADTDEKIARQKKELYKSQAQINKSHYELQNQICNTGSKPQAMPKEQRKELLKSQVQLDKSLSEHYQQNEKTLWELQKTQKELSDSRRLIDKGLMQLQNYTKTLMRMADQKRSKKRK